MKKLFMISGLVVAMAPGLTLAEVPQATRQVRADAVRGLRSLPCRFISEQTLVDALSFIDKELDPKTHQQLLGLQLEADELTQQRLAMLSIPGIDVTHPAIVYLDSQLVLVEKRLDDLLYNGGFLNWKTMLGIGAGAIAGVATYAGKMPMLSGKNIIGSLITGLTVAIVLELSLRGRRAVIGGNFASLAKFISRVTAKFFRACFGDGGYIDRMVAAVERGLRKVGKKIDGVMDNRWVTLGIGVASGVVVSFLLYRIFKTTKDAVGAANKGTGQDTAVHGAAAAATVVNISA